MNLFRRVYLFITEFRARKAHKARQEWFTAVCRSIASENGADFLIGDPSDPGTLE